MVATPQDFNAARRESLELFDAANERWFGFLTDDAIVYAINHTEPYRGRSAYETRFRPFLTRARRESTIVSSDDQNLGNTIVVAQTLRIIEDNILVNVRQSVIWVNNDGWKIRHLHSALIGAPMGTRIPNTAAEVTVLNEKIATMAAVVGVAQ